MFRVSLVPSKLSDAEKWVEFAVAKGVKELDVDFFQTAGFDEFGLVLCKSPNSIFSCNSITHLKLRSCNFCPPLNFKGYTYLETLYLSLVRLTNALLESMLSNCPLLEELSLRDCRGLTRIKVSTPYLPLKSLTVDDCWDADEIEIFAPNLQSFRFYGNFMNMYFKNISSLVDVLVNGLCRDIRINRHDWMTVLHQLEHVKILTLCNGSLEHIDLVEGFAPQDLPITFHNLQELQLLMDWYGGSYLACTYSFFKNCPCPCLEKLFIQLMSARTPLKETTSSRDFRQRTLGSV